LYSRTVSRHTRTNNTAPDRQPGGKDYTEPQSEILTKLILTVPALFIAVCAPPAGLFIDRFGRMKLMRAALIGYGLSGTAVLFLQDIYLILVSRALLGVAVAGVMTTTITLIADYFSGMERDEFMGLQGAFVTLSGLTTAVFIGQFISPFFLQPILENTAAGQIFLIAALGMSGIALAYLGFAFFVQKALTPGDEKI
jgi:MFS family permease